MASTILFCSSFMVALAMASFMITAGSLKSSTGVLITVDKLGRGNFMKIQDAIDVVPSNNSVHVLISIKPGVYEENVVIPEDKPFITLKGEHTKSTIIRWDGRWKAADKTTLFIQASDVVVKQLTVQNEYNLTREGAIAVRVSGDRVAFFSCRFLGIQDTVLDDSGKHYYWKCYIEGATDFICGNGKSLFQNCALHSTSTYGGAITAHRRKMPTEDTYFIFRHCKITGTKGGRAILGRPWGSYSRVVFAYSYMSSVVLPEGWRDWPGVPPRKWTTYYGQRKCYGHGANVTRRVKWSHKLSKSEAAPFLNISAIIGPKDQEWIRSPKINYKIFFPGIFS
ncbi:putative pectinesterase 11 [Asparagus officinalis]|uniref:putative pectinesterase 11 n=1 Tax=Asparagus officinalis TaxID=4686 RepID=UPI00098E6AC0|nr:putative pectinesterase 11 [Asparagus officinalis]XP_020269416.1 putative pectinesterase 11 [Asparagus officinalis]